MMSERDTEIANQPMDTVRAWWQALQDRDLDAFATTLDEHHVSAGTPEGRTFGRDAALTDARQFLQRGSVDTWNISEVVERTYAQTAVCSYAWQETGRTNGSRFRLTGVATDVLLREGRSWVITAHHTSLTPSSDPA